MKRPDLNPLACVNPTCQRFCLTGQGHLTVRPVYGQDGLRLLRCRLCGEDCSVRRGTALFNPKITETPAVDVLDHLGAGCGGHAIACLSRVSTDTVAHLLRMAGRQAERVHDRRVRYGTPHT